MSTTEDKTPLFPEEWGWQRYEGTFREYVEQIAQAEELHVPRSFAQLHERPNYSSYAGAKIRRCTALRWEKPLKDRNPPLSSMTPTNRNEPGTRKPARRHRRQEKDFGRDR